MPRGKKQSGRPSAGGIKRNDYHRRNRKRNISMHKHSHGYNAGVGHLERLANQACIVPSIEKDELIRLADKAERDPKASIEQACVNYLRHCSTYDKLNAARVSVSFFGAGYLFVFKRILDAISAAYPWLAGECEQQYHDKTNRVRVIKRVQQTGQLTSAQLHDFNSCEDEEAERGFISEFYQEDVALDGALTSLASSRLLYQPPFLPREEIAARRFTDQYGEMNDRWWEWEEEKGLRVPDREKPRFAWT